MRRVLISLLIVGVVVAVYSCGAGRGTVPDAVRASVAWAAIVGLVVGVMFGRSWQRAERGVVDWRATTLAARRSRRDAASLVWATAKAGALVAVAYGVGALLGLWH